MDLASVVEGPLLRSSFLIFILGIFARLYFFFSAIIKSGRGKEFRLGYILLTIVRLFVPFHKAVFKKPFYTFLRYIFHLCLIAVPICFTGHIVLWELSRFGWNWPALPYVWADGMTLLLLGLAAYFLIRRLVSPLIQRMVSPEIRLNSSLSDYLLITITALPFLTGYFLTHDTLGSIAFLGDNMRLMHVLSSEAMLVATPFLFCRTWLKEKKCIGCAACEVSCPTETLASSDEGKLRNFIYSHYQCICCGACVKTCPEAAAELRHEINFKRFFQVARKHEICHVELKECERCGAFFAPEPQLNKIIQLPELNTIRKPISDEHLRICPKCRKANLADTLYQLAPKPKKIKKQAI